MPRGHPERMWKVRWWFVALWKSLFSNFFVPARNALVALLRKHKKEDQAVALMRGELTELRLYACRIGDNGAEIVAEFLKHDEAVMMVLLYNCNIGPRGAKALSAALKRNEAVEDLNLACNEIGDEGADAIIDAVRENVCIVWLYNKTIISGQPMLTGRTMKNLAEFKYLTETRSAILIPAAARRASLCIIAARRNITNAGILAIFPKEIVKMIAIEVWATRKEPIWIKALTESEQTGETSSQ